MKRLAPALVPLFTALLLGACGNAGTSPPSPPDATPDGAQADDAASDDAAAPTDAPATSDGAGSCPTSCPAGQIVVTWNLSSPGFPGPSGCACKPDPCADGGVGCPCDPACQLTAPGGGCCNWFGSALSCNACG
ncbi:MAG TPA: hypothetical protein VIF15_20115 [Polyangiaceae bacterium]|jgi:hypothetical protein